jgi:aminoglycoside 6-adenylyltransferase
VNDRIHDRSIEWTPSPESHIVQWCDGRDLVRAVILTSTRAAVANARVDKFSDLDVILVMSDIRPLCEDRQWLSDFGDVLAAWRDRDALQLDPPRTCWVTQYADGLKIDFTLWPAELLRHVSECPRLPDQLDVGYRVLVDKDQLTTKLKPASHRAHIPAPPSPSEFIDVVEEFFLESTYVAKHLWRDDLMPAKFSLDHVMKHGALRTVFEWLIEIEHDWSFQPGAAGKGLKEFLPEHLYRALEKTYVGAAPDENWRALFHTIGLFRKVADHVGERLGYEYPRGLDGRVMTYLQEVLADAVRKENRT